jgi:DNA-binding IclR family transcriptional regulator
MRKGTPRIAALGRSLATLEAVVAEGGRTSTSALARQLGIPVATAHRQVTSLVAEGYLTPSGGGHIAGPRLLGLMQHLDERQILASVAAPVLHKLAGETRSIVQMGTFENDMVTYRVKAGQGASGLFTRVGMQLEAYCTGIGKVLLAHLPSAECDRYLATGPFVALTTRTITDAAVLARALATVRERGFAIDDEEMQDGLICMAVPLHTRDSSVIAAISVSQDARSSRLIAADVLLPLLRQAAGTIEAIAFG